MNPTSTNAPAPPSRRPSLAVVSWPRVLELGLAFVLGALTLLLLEYGWRRVSAGGQPSTSVEVICYRLDLNQAGCGELAQLPGIGPALANRIVSYRQQNGPFVSIDSLRDVKGIGPATVEQLRPRLEVAAGKGTSATVNVESNVGRVSSARKPPLNEPIDINRSGRDELMKLPGIGRVLADRIVTEREANGRYRTKADLKRVKGIKDRMLEKLLPSITVGDAAVATDGTRAQD